MLSKGVTAGDLVTPQNVEIVDIDTSSDVSKVGSWQEVVRSAAVGLSCIESNNAGDYIYYRFNGSGIWLRYMLYQDGGIADIYLDGNKVGSINCYAPTTETQFGFFVYAFIAIGLPIDWHEVKIVVTGTKSAESAGYTVYLDAFTVEHQPGALQVYSMIEGSPPVSISSFLGRGDFALVFEASPWGYDYDKDVLKERMAYEWDLPPTQIPTTQGAIYSGNVYVNSLLVLNTNSTSVTVTITDLASPSHTYVSSKTISANDLVTIINVVKPILFRNGIGGVASASGVYLIASGYI